MLIPEDNVVEIDEPHAVLSSGWGKPVHAVPMSLLRRIANGSQKIEECEDCEELVRSVFSAFVQRLDDETFGC